jgi:hypothetical protein
MKMDVEGYESEVLKGAHGLLTKHNVWHIMTGEDVPSVKPSARAAPAAALFSMLLPNTRNQPARVSLGHWEAALRCSGQPLVLWVLYPDFVVEQRAQSMYTRTHKHKLAHAHTCAHTHTHTHTLTSPQRLLFRPFTYTLSAQTQPLFSYSRGQLRTAQGRGPGSISQVSASGCPQATPPAWGRTGTGPQRSRGRMRKAEGQGLLQVMGYPLT